MLRRTLSTLLIAVAAVLCLTPALRAQPGRVDMLAATATSDSNTPEVRLVWRIGQGWLTTDGVRVYRCDPAALKLDDGDTRGMDPEAAGALKKGNYCSRTPLSAGA